MERLKVIIPRRELGSGRYFRGEKPHCMVGHVLHALGEKDTTHIREDVHPKLQFLLSRHNSSHPYSRSWQIITDANDAAVHERGSFDDAIREFANHDIDVVVV